MAVKPDLSPDLSPEVGTIADYNDRLFLYYLDGQALIPSTVGTAEINDMLAADGRARAIEQVLTLPIRSAKWQIHPDPKDNGEAAFCTDVLGEHLPLIIGQMTSAQLYARAYFELVWTPRDDGRIGVQVHYRPPATCELARTQEVGEFDGFWQWAWKGMGGIHHVQIPKQRAFVFLHGKYRAPWAGISELQTCYAIFATKQKIRWLWYRFLENYSMPRAIATAAAGDDNEAIALAQKVAKLKGGGVVGLKAGQTVAPFSVNAPGADQYAAALKYLDAEMSSSVLASFLDLASGTSGRGSFALSQDQTDFFLQSREGVVAEIRDEFRHGLLKPVVRYNFGADAAVPHLTSSPLSVLDSSTAVTLLQAIAGAPPGSTELPQEFIDLLIEQVAGYFGMNVDKITSAIRARQQTAPAEPAAQLGAAVNTVHAIVRNADAATGHHAAARATRAAR